MEINGLSIVIPTYNRPKLLEEAINSILKQNYQSWELIVIDDNSTTDPGILMDELMKRDGRIKYLKNERRKGPSATRNVGIDHAAFDHIMFVDDDIILRPDAMEMLVNDYNRIFDSGINIGAITPGVIIIDSTDIESARNGEYVEEKGNLAYGVQEIKRSKYTGLIFDNFTPKHEKLQEVPHVHACSLYSKKALLSAGKYDDELYKGNYLYEDADLAYRVWKKGYVFYFEPKAVFYHIKTSDGGCRVKNKKINTYFFIINWIKYLRKNYQWKSIYMIPFFGGFLVLRGVQKILDSTNPSKRSGV